MARTMRRATLGAGADAHEAAGAAHRLWATRCAHQEVVVELAGGDAWQHGDDMNVIAGKFHAGQRR